MAEAFLEYTENQEEVLSVILQQTFLSLLVRRTENDFWLEVHLKSLCLPTLIAKCLDSTLQPGKYHGYQLAN